MSTPREERNARERERYHKNPEYAKALRCVVRLEKKLAEQLLTAEELAELDNAKQYVAKVRKAKDAAKPPKPKKKAKKAKKAKGDPPQTAEEIVERRHAWYLNNKKKYAPGGQYAENKKKSLEAQQKKREEEFLKWFNENYEEKENNEE